MDSRSLSLVLLILLCVCCEQSASDDLYEVLGIDKSATHQEIKYAYKQLAREWHPDKNKAPDAADKFTKINEAYETLGNKERKRQYDNFGYTSAQEPQRRGHPGGFPFEGFPSFFQDGSFRFSFNEGGGRESIFDRYLITLRSYESRVLPDSYKRPYLIYVYTDFCFQCMRIEHLVEKLFKDLEELGYGLATVHLGMERSLAGELGVSHIPSVLGIMNGRVSFFNTGSGVYSMSAMRDFARGLFPHDTVNALDDKNIDQFLNAWKVDNRVRGILFAKRDSPPARYLLTAHAYRGKVTFGFVTMDSSNQIENIEMRFPINSYKETFLMFNEDTLSPMATVSMPQISRSTLEEVIQSNQHLTLPRLSSQAIMDDLCPYNHRPANKKLCIVLMTKQSNQHDMHRATFRDYARRSRAPVDKVSFLYMYQDVQYKLTETLSSRGYHTMNGQSGLEVAIFWRVDRDKLSYEWLETGWLPDLPERRKCEENLTSTITVLLNSDRFLTHRAVIGELYNEHALGLMTRIGSKLLLWWGRIKQLTNRFDMMSWMTGGIAIAAIFILGYMMQKLVNIEEEAVQRQKPLPKCMPRPTNRTEDGTLYIHDLGLESYNMLVRQADAGLTLTILLDEVERPELLQRFAEIMFPYSRYNGFSFAVLRLEEYIGWYQTLLEQTTDFHINQVNISIKNCCGTILALNGYRKYFYIYHPKSARKFMIAKKKMSIGRAMGLYDTDDSDTEDERTVRSVGSLLDGLANWMDRLLDGSTKRIRIPDWPDM